MSEPFELTGAQKAAGIQRIEENLALLSGAGCGKTFVLARRFTALLGGGVDPQRLRRLVALTFTEKAAIEMSQRVRRMLRDRASRAGSERDRAMLLGWLEELPEARIGTIHSFCAALLRAHAVEAGLDPNFAVCSDTLASEAMLTESVEQAVLAALEAEDAAAAELVSESGYGRIGELVGRLVGNRTLQNPADFTDPATVLARWQRALGKTREEMEMAFRNDGRIRKCLADLSQFTCTDPADKLAPAMARLKAVTERAIKQGPHTVGEALAEAAEEKYGTAGSVKNWQGAAPKEIRDAMKRLQALLDEYAAYFQPMNEADRLAAETLAALCRLAVDAWARYDRRKQSQGMVDFDDLLFRAAELIERDPLVARQLGAGIEQMLIDEAQDTDRLQLRLLLSILGAEETGIPQDGRLFVVGDAKQSIYRFRGAQVEVFEELCRRLGRPHQEILDRSFRTHQPGVAFVNHVFEPLMGESYSPIHSNRPTAPESPTVELLLAEESESFPLENAAQSVSAQAALTAQRIEELLRDGEKRIYDSRDKTYRSARPGDVAILFSRMTHSLEFERRLQQRDIPYYVVAGTGFYQQQEVFDVLNALRAIENPCDDVAFLGFLRSAMVGLDDNALMHIAETHRPPYLENLRPEALRGRLSAGESQRLLFARDLLRDLHRRKDALRLDELIRAVLDETGFEAVLLSQFQGPRRVGNVRRLIELARPGGQRIAIAEFIRQVGRRIIDNSREEQAATTAEGENVVRLMTIHKAKGLEFPVVVVPDLNRGSQAPRSSILHRVDFGMTMRPTGGEDDPDDNPQSDCVARRLETLDQQRETLRQYYVALTRHRDSLLLVGADRRTRDGRFKDTDSFLAELDGVLGIADAVDERRDELRYGPRLEYTASLAKRKPQEADRRGREQPPGEAMLAEANGIDNLAEALTGRAKPSADTPLLIGALPEETGRCEIAATALVEFQHCPRLYRWRYELRGPSLYAGPAERGDGPLDPLTLGTLLHKAMEHLDAADPQPPAELIHRAAAELELADHVNLDELAALYEPMQANFLSGPHAARMAAAEEVCRELDFLLRVGPGVVRGQIDLLYRSDGAWRVVDYKSDRVDDARAASKAEHYRVQMLLYALAVSRLTGEPPAEVSLYFLRSGIEQAVDVSPGALDAAREQIEQLARRLIRARRSGDYPACGDPGCPVCGQSPAPDAQSD